MQWKELEVVFLVKPRALETKNPQAGQPRERERVPRQLLNRPLFRSVGLVVQDVNRAIADLNQVYVTGQKFWKGYRFFPTFDANRADTAFRYNIGTGTLTLGFRIFLY